MKRGMTMKKLRIGIDFGHSLKGVGYGMVGLVHESVETRNIGYPLIKMLEDLGHTVINVTVDYAKSVGEGINGRVNKANKSNLDILVSIHLNAFDGTAFGVEVLTYQGKKLVQAERTLENIAKLGYHNRGIKHSPRKLGIIDSTTMPTMLVECFFGDNKGDVSKYKPNEIAKAIAEGVTGQSIKGIEVIDKVIIPSIEPSMLPNSINVKLLNKEISTKGFLEDGVNYMHINDSYVSIREILENLGFKISWNADNKCIVAQLSKDFKATNESATLDILGSIVKVNAILKDGKHCLKIDNAYIPIRDIFETLGFKVGWNKETETIEIK